MPVFVSLSGLPGVGKSTVSQALAQRTGALWPRVDQIEQAMRGSDHVPEDMGGLGYYALMGAAEGALAQGFDVIGDSVNPIALTRGWFREMSARARAWHLDVVLSCSDQAVHRARVEARGPSVPGLPPLTWGDVQAREWEPFGDADLALDTAVLSVPEAVDKIVEKMGEARG